MRTQTERIKRGKSPSRAVLEQDRALHARPRAKEMKTEFCLECGIDGLGGGEVWAGANPANADLSTGGEGTSRWM